MIFGEIGKSANLEKFGRIEIWKNGFSENSNLEKCKSGKMQFGEMQILKNTNLET